MAQTPSTMMMELGAPAPHFELMNIDGGSLSLDDVSGARGLLVMFICNHCPFVKHIRAELARIGTEYVAKGIGVVAINSNDVANYPDDSPEKMRLEADEAGYTFAYLFDETQEVAKAYGAACTPDFYVFDGERRLVYRGQLDESRPGNGVGVTGEDLRAALDAVAAGEAVVGEQQPSIGCNIKWKKGNAPVYA